MMASNPALTAYVGISGVFGDITNIVATASHVLVECSIASAIANARRFFLSADGLSFTVVSITDNSYVAASTSSLLLIVPVLANLTQTKKYNGSAWVDAGLPPVTTSAYFSGTMTRPFAVNGANDKVFAFCDLTDHQTNAVFYTSDGTNWTEINVPVAPHPIYDPARPYHKMFYKDGTYYLLSKKVAYYTSTDLVTWTEHKFYNPYLYSGVSNMPDVLDMYFTEYGGADQIWFLQSANNSPSTAVLFLVASETGGLVGATSYGSRTDVSNAGNGIFYTQGSFVYYWSGSAWQVSGAVNSLGTVYTAISSVLFNGSLLVGTDSGLYSSLYDSGWITGGVPDLSISGPTETQYFTLNVGEAYGESGSYPGYDEYEYLGSSPSYIDLSASGGTPSYSWSAGAPSTLVSVISGSGSGETTTVSVSYNIIGSLTLYGRIRLLVRNSDYRLYSLDMAPRVVYTVNAIGGTFTVTDSATPVADTASITVSAYPRLSTATGGGNLTVSALTTLPDATVGAAYSQSLGSVSGGTSPYTWSLISKTWADAATVSAAGVLSTTFTTAGIYSLDVNVTDSSQPSESVVTQITVSAVVSPYTATIEGTLRLDTPTGAFAARKVYLYNYTTGALVAETTSDATLGTWSFTAVAPGDYFVVGAATSDDYTTFNRDFDAMGVITVV